MKLINYKGDIGIIENVFPPYVCPQLVKAIDFLQAENTMVDRQVNDNCPRNIKDDLSVCMHYSELDSRLFHLYNNQGTQEHWQPHIEDGLRNSFCLYSDKVAYGDIKSLNLRLSAIKLQKTMPGGGYHVWHSEKGPNEPSRYVVFLAYLNTLAAENCGETEFIRQEFRVTPKENTIIFWPATYTHPHRGNPVYGNVAKYVLTGWLYI